MTTDNSNGDNDGEDRSFTISLWLLPSPRYRAKISRMIEAFSQHEAASVPFEPHITIVGGVSCPSNEYLHTTLLPKLKEAIQNTTRCLDCQLGPNPVYKETWNQACVMVLKESEEFAQLVHLCRELAFGKPSIENIYPPPLRKPHLSLYYGMEGAPSKEDIAQGLGGSYTFGASQVAVWKTDPGSAEGVAQWTELAVIDLPEQTARS